MRGATAQVDAPAANFQEEEHVKLLEPYRLHRKEVNGQDLLGVLTNEVAPADAGTLGSRADSVPPEDVANGEMRTGIAQLDQLALNASVAPPWVLASQAQNQLPNLRCQPRPTEPSPAARVQGPLPTDKLAVPTEQRLGSDEERAPGWPGQPPAQRREQQSVRPPPTRFSDLALEHAKLMTENENRHVEIALRTRAQERESDATDLRRPLP
jgi:hypothetical protein